MRYAITGVTGKVGGALARELLASGHTVRAVLRDAGKAAPWSALGCEVALAEMADAAALTAAFADRDGVFVLLPPSFDPSPGFPELAAILAALRTALLATRPARVVCISTVGAQATTENLLSSLGIMERTLGELPLATTFLRPAWFLDNAAWDIASARTGVLPSFLQPLDRRVPMVATQDVAHAAAELLQETWRGRRVVELEGPSRISPDDIAAVFAALLGAPVRATAVPRATWPALFTEQGMANPTPRIRMLDGFNDGWIDFASPSSTRKGTTTLETVLRNLLAA